MASEARLFATGADELVIEHALSKAWSAIDEVAISCNRFDPSSELTVLNRDPSSPSVVSPPMFHIVSDALLEYRRTEGRFDPRVLRELEELGYDRSFSRGPGPGSSSRAQGDKGTWQPALDPRSLTVNLGGSPIDLGGIAKGWAADRAGEVLASYGLGGLVDLGGDGHVAGPDEHCQPWSIGVEDPFGGSDPIATFSLSRGAYATSSIKLRSWVHDGAQVHHLIDPSTGDPGGRGLVAVTMLAESAQRAEVDAKVAFLAGIEGIYHHVATHGLAALWVTESGAVEYSPGFAEAMTWMRP